MVDVLQTGGVNVELKDCLVSDWDSRDLNHGLFATIRER
jgi:hypothetical protein